MHRVALHCMEMSPTDPDDSIPSAIRSLFAGSDFANVTVFLGILISHTFSAILPRICPAFRQNNFARSSRPHLSAAFVHISPPESRASSSQKFSPSFRSQFRRISYIIVARYLTAYLPAIRQQSVRNCWFSLFRLLRVGPHFFVLTCNVALAFLCAIGSIFH